LWCLFRDSVIVLRIFTDDEGVQDGKILSRSRANVRRDSKRERLRLGAGDQIESFVSLVLPTKIEVSADVELRCLLMEVLCCRMVTACRLHGNFQ
jgi:hypothetical protein